MAFIAITPHAGWAGVASSSSPVKTETLENLYSIERLEALSRLWIKQKINVESTHLPELLPYVQAHFNFTREGIEKHEREAKGLHQEDRFAWVMLQQDIDSRIENKQVTLSWWLYLNRAFSLFLTPPKDRICYFNDEEDTLCTRLMQKKAWYSYAQYIEHLKDPGNTYPGKYDLLIYPGLYSLFPPEPILESNSLIPFPTIDGNLTLRQLNESVGKHFYFIGLTQDTIVADGQPMSPEHFYRHDIQHMHFYLVRGGKWEETRCFVELIYQAIQKEENPQTKEELEFIYFQATHEVANAGMKINQVYWTQSPEYLRVFAVESAKMVVTRQISYSEALSAPEWYGSVAPETMKKDFSVYEKTKARYNEIVKSLEYKQKQAAA